MNKEKDYYHYDDIATIRYNWHRWWLDKSWLDEREREVIKTFEEQPLGTETNLTNNKWKEMMTSRTMVEDYNDDDDNNDANDDRGEEADHALSQLLCAPVRQWTIYLHLKLNSRPNFYCMDFYISPISSDCTMLNYFGNLINQL